MNISKLVGALALLAAGWWLYRAYQAQRSLEQQAEAGTVSAETVKANRTKLIVIGVALVIGILVLARITGLWFIPL